MILRRLNDDGVLVFQDFVEGLRNGRQLNTPLYLLDDPAFSEAVTISVTLDQHEFSSRYELGCYLTEKFHGCDMQPFVGDIGFWSWLALFWFDQLCPEVAGGLRKPSEVPSYILSEVYGRRPRHAIYTTWQLVDRYGEDSRFFLSKELPVRGELIEQMMARQAFFGFSGVIRLASELYYDAERKTFKKGAAARKSAGCLYRYIGWLQQLEVNYDLYSVTKDDLKGLLPSEFGRFIGGAGQN